MVRPRRAFAALLAIACVGLLLPATGLAKGGSLDLGDAPDGASAGYKGKGVTGAFPSKLASGGPRHAGLPALHLGPRVDGESDSHQVDRDRHDDGAEAKLAPCSDKSRLTVALDGRRLPADRSSAGTIYVNAWFDWNRDGDWADGDDGCAAEWAIRNLPVPAASLGPDGLRLLPIAFKAGKQTRELWWRVTVTVDEPAPDAGGRGPVAGYAFGETEDYVQRPVDGKPRFPDPTFEEEEKEEEKKGKGKPKLGVGCNPWVAVIPHGATARVGFNISAPGKGGPVFGAFASPKGGKGFKTGLIPHPNQGGIPPGKVLATGFTFKSSDVDPPVRFQLFAMSFVFSRGETVRKITCYILVVHEGKGHGKKGKHKHGKHPPKIPAVRCEGPCAGKPGQTGPTPPPEQPKHVVEGQAQAKGSGTPHIDFNVQFNSPLEQFLLVFSGGYQVKEGAGNDGKTNFSCNPMEYKGQSALVCNGPVQPGLPIVGGLMLEGQNAPLDIHMQMQLYGAAGGTLYGPFPVGPLGP